MAVSISTNNFDIDLVTLPNEKEELNGSDDENKTSTEPQKTTPKSSKWDWNALFVPFNDHANHQHKYSHSPSNIKPPKPSTSQQSPQQQQTSKSPLKHTTKTYRESKDIPPWISNNYSNENFLDRLHMELIDFCMYVSPTKEEHSMRLELIERIKKIVLEIWPNASIHVFGSMKTKLYLPTSDIDIVVYPQNDDEDNNNNITNDPKLLLAQSLKNNNMCSYLEIISSARVPLVKFTDDKTDIAVDICFERETGIKAAEEINSLQQKYPALRPLTYFLKYFLWYRDLNEPFRGGMGSYLLQMLIINMIQTHPIRATKRWRYVDSEISLGGWLMAFFQLYGKQFNYSELGISPHPRAHYFLKEDHHKMKIYDRPYLLCCACPFESTSSKVMDSGRNTFNIMKIKSSFEWAYNTLLANCNHKNQSILRLLVGLRGQMLQLRSTQNKLVKFEIKPHEAEMNRLIVRTFNHRMSDDEDDDDVDSEQHDDDSNSTDVDSNSTEDNVSDTESVNENGNENKLFIPFDDKNDELSSSSVSSSTSSSSSYYHHVYGNNDNMNEHDSDEKDDELSYYEASDFQHKHLFHQPNNKKNDDKKWSMKFSFENKDIMEENPYLNKKYNPLNKNDKKREKIDGISDDGPALKKRKIALQQSSTTPQTPNDKNNNKYIFRSYSMPDLRKSTPCIFYQKGNCKKGKVCPFQHGVDNKKGIKDTELLTDFTLKNIKKVNQVCWNYVKGNCNRKNCRWLHPMLKATQAT